MLNNCTTEVDVQGVQFMKCVICYSSENSSSFQSSTKFQKGFVTYNPKHGITSMQKHVANEHILEYLLHKNSNVKGRNGGKQKKMQAKGIYHTYNHHDFFGKCEPYKKSNPIELGFIEDLVLMIAKGYMPLSIVESPWLRRMVFTIVVKFNFLFVNNLFVNTFLFYCRKPWQFMCSL